MSVTSTTRHAFSPSAPAAPAAPIALNFGHDSFAHLRAATDGLVARATDDGVAARIAAATASHLGAVDVPNAVSKLPPMEISFEREGLSTVTTAPRVPPPPIRNAAFTTPMSKMLPTAPEVNIVDVRNILLYIPWISNVYGSYLVLKACIQFTAAVISIVKSSKELTISDVAKRCLAQMKEIGNLATSLNFAAIFAKFAEVKQIIQSDDFSEPCELVYFATVNLIRGIAAQWFLIGNLLLIGADGIRSFGKRGASEVRFGVFEEEGDCLAKALMKVFDQVRVAMEHVATPFNEIRTRSQRSIPASSS